MSSAIDYSIQVQYTFDPVDGQRIVVRSKNSLAVVDVSRIKSVQLAEV